MVKIFMPINEKTTIQSCIKVYYSDRFEIAVDDEASERLSNEKLIVNYTMLRASPTYFVRAGVELLHTSIRVT